MLSRRNFLKSSALGLAGVMSSQAMLGATMPIPAAETKKRSANDKVNLAFIGLGVQAMNLLNANIIIDGVRVVAGCDVYDVKRHRFVTRVTDYYRSKGEKKVKVDVYEDYQDVLARKDVDAVIIATPDHQHAIIAIAACKAGKDVYLEKPLTLTVHEGQLLCKAVRKYNRVLQVGSMQRSSPEFIHAANVVREGMLGNVQRVQVFVGRNVNKLSGAPIPYNLPKMEVPAGLNWDKWLGPLPTSVYYNEQLAESCTDTQPEKGWGAWRWYKPMGGGLMTDWGAHMFDIAQWMLGKDGNGPVEVIPPGYDFYPHLTYRYDNGVVMTEEPLDGGAGVRVYGDEGWIEVHRGLYKTSDKRFDMPIPLAEIDAAREVGIRHHEGFINAIRSRNDPNVPVEVGHSSCNVCNIGNIAIELNRPVKWNPIVQKFMNDEEATKFLHYQYREGYSLEF